MSESMTGYYKIDHIAFWGIVWGGITFQTIPEVEAKWQSLCGDKVTAVHVSHDDVAGYKAGGFEVIDLEDGQTEMTKPTFPLTDEQEQELIDFDECYTSQYDSLTEWKNEVAQFGDVTFPRPVIKPLVYPARLQHWIDLVKQYNADLAKWEAESTEDADDCPFEDIPF